MKEASGNSNSSGSGSGNSGSGGTLKQRTARGIAWGAAGNVLQQALSLAAGIILARLLSADEYGMVGVLAIFTAIAAVLLDGGFAAALINRQDATEEHYNAVFWFNVAMGLGLYAILWIAAPYIAAFYRLPELTALARYVFFGFVLGCTIAVHSAVLTKRLLIKRKMIVHVTALLVSSVVGVVMAWQGMSYWAIASQTMSYMLVLTVGTWIVSPWRPAWQFGAAPLRQMLPFSIKVALTNIFNQINQNVLTVLLGRFYDARQVGYYTQGSKWMTMGSSLVNNMVSGVSQPVLATTAAEPERQLRAFRKMLRFQAMVAMPVMLGIALIAPELITLAITDKWSASVPILQLLCLWGAMVPINNLFSSMAVSRGDSGVYLRNTVALGCLQVAALLSVGLLHDGIGALLLTFVAINIAWVGVWNLYARRAIGMRFRFTVADIAPFAGAAAAAVLLGWAAARPIASLWLALAVKVAVTAAAYCATLWMARVVIFREAVQFLISTILRKKPTDNEGTTTI